MQLMEGGDLAGARALSSQRDGGLWLRVSECRFRDLGFRGLGFMASDLGLAPIFGTHSRPQAWVLVAWSSYQRWFSLRP